MKELDYRTSNGIDVTLLWHPETGRVAIRVLDWSTEAELELEVDPAHALDAFNHPYAYAARGRALEPVHA
jgi:hypothetical protein